MFSALFERMREQERQSIDNIQCILLKIGSRFERSLLFKTKEREILECELVNIVAAVRGLTDTNEPLTIRHSELGEMVLHIPAKDSPLVLTFVEDEQTNSIY